MPYPISFRTSQCLLTRWLEAERSRAAEGEREAVRAIEILSRRRTTIRLHSEAEARLLLRSARAIYDLLPHRLTQGSLYLETNRIARECGLEDEQRRLLGLDQVASFMERLRTPIDGDMTDMVAEQLYELAEGGAFPAEHGFADLSEEEKHPYRQQALGILGLLRVIGYVAVEREVLATAAALVAAAMPPLQGPLPTLG